MGDEYRDLQFVLHGLLIEKIIYDFMIIVMVNGLPTLHHNYLFVLLLLKKRE
jgi:hypothetical protein